MKSLFFCFKFYSLIILKTTNFYKIRTFFYKLRKRYFIMIKYKISKNNFIKVFGGVINEKIYRNIIKGWNRGNRR